FLASHADNAERLRVSGLLIRAIHGAFLVDGTVHADPHPGNFLVMPDGRLGVLDFGSVKRFSREFFEGHRDVFRAVVEQKPIDAPPSVRGVVSTGALPGGGPRALGGALLPAASRALRTDDYDYAHDPRAPDSRNLVVSHAAQFLKIRPPAEGVMFVRAFGGLQQNLRLLGARGDFRPFYRSLLPRLA